MAEFTINSKILPSRLAMVHVPSGFVVLWSNLEGTEILGARFNMAGVKQGDDFSVGMTLGSISTPVAALLRSFSSPGFVVAWISGTDIFLQRFNAQAQKNGAAIKVNTTSVDATHAPAIVSLVDASIVVSWGDAAETVGVRAQMFDAQGAKIGAELAVNSTQGVHFRPVLSQVQNVGFVVSWEGGFAHGATTGRFQIFDAQGGKLGEERMFRRGVNGGVSTMISAIDGQFTRVVVLPIFATETTATDKTNMLIAETYDANGSGQLLNALNITHRDDETISSTPTIQALPIGGVIVTWAQRKAPETADFDKNIKAVILSSDLSSSSTIMSISNVQSSDVEFPCTVPVITDNAGFILPFAWVQTNISPSPSFTALKGRVFSSSLQAT